VRDQKHHAVDLAVDVGSSLGRGVEPGACLGDHALEVSDDLLGLY
jgi:hypothetical protein